MIANVRKKTGQFQCFFHDIIDYNEFTHLPSNVAIPQTGDLTDTRAIKHELSRKTNAEDDQRRQLAVAAHVLFTNDEKII